MIKDDHASMILAKLAKEHSGILMILKSTRGSINLLCLGPLTNVILAYHIEHNLYEMFKRVVVSGGSIYQRGSLSKSGDFNFTSDAHSANLIIKIFKSKCTIIPSEINFKYTFDTEEMKFVRKLIIFFTQNDNSTSEIWNKIKSILKYKILEILKLRKRNNSLGAVLYVKDINLVKDSITTKCQVETRSKECLGQLLILWPINNFFSHAFPDEFKKMEVDLNFFSLIKTTNIIKEMSIDEGKKLANICFASITV